MKLISDTNKMAIDMLIQQVSIWEEMIDNDALKGLASETKQRANRNNSMMAILPHFNSMSDIDKAQAALTAKAKLFDALANVIDAAREAKKIGVDVDADLKLQTT